MNEYFLLITLIKKSLDFFAIPEVLDPTGRVTHTPHTHIQYRQGTVLYSTVYIELYIRSILKLTLSNVYSVLYV